MSFLFASKLLPLFLYPLGLACLFLIWAFFLALRRSRSAILPIVLTFILLMTSGNVRFANNLMKSLEWQNIPPQELPTADAIVVLGGATRTVAPPRVMPDLSDRGDRIWHAAQLYKEGKAPVIILSGGKIQWYGDQVSEASDLEQFLELAGIPKSAIIKEENSTNTYENAIFTKPILEEQGIKKILLVTSAFHTPRSLKIFEQAGIEAIAAPTDFLISEQEIAEVNFSTQSKILSFIPNSGSLQRTTIVLKEYLGTLVYRLKGWL